jgi:hypothetical protein
MVEKAQKTFTFKVERERDDLINEQVRMAEKMGIPHDLADQESTSVEVYVNYVITHVIVPNEGRGVVEAHHIVEISDNQDDTKTSFEGTGREVDDLLPHNIKTHFAFKGYNVVGLVITEPLKVTPIKSAKPKKAATDES